MDSTPITIKTNAQRLAEIKAKKKAAGLVRCEIWVHSDDKEKLKRYGQKLTIARFKR